MKKKIVIIFAVTIVLAAVLVVTTAVRPKTLGNMKSSFSSPKTTSSLFEFAAEAGDRVHLAFSSDIKSGGMTVTLYDSNGGEVKTLDSAKELRTYWTLEKTDSYTLCAECTEMVGSYNLKLTKA